MKGYALGHALGQAIARVGLLGVACSLLAYIGGYLSRPWFSARWLAASLPGYGWTAGKFTGRNGRQ